MKIKNSALCTLGLAAAITLGGAVSASAQRTPSETRIPVRKDQPAEPMPMRVDTVFRTRVDTVTLPGRTETVTRVQYDTVVRMQMLPLQPLPSLSFGIGAGFAVPLNNWRNSTKDGPVVGAHLAFFPGQSALGIRFDGDASFLSKRETNCPTCPNPRIYQGGADLVARFPIDRTSKINPVIYFLGGGGFTKFSNFLPYQANGRVVTGGSNTFPTVAFPPPGGTGVASGPPFTVTAANRGTKSIFYNYNVGGGLEFGAGAVHLFTEAKYVTINTTDFAFTGTTVGGQGGQRSHFVPILAGLKFGY